VVGGGEGGGWGCWVRVWVRRWKQNGCFTLLAWANFAPTNFIALVKIL